MQVNQSNNNLDIRGVFNATACPYLILNPDLIIIEVNNAYLKATQRSRDELLGQYIFDAFPDNPNDPLANGVENLQASLQSVLQNKSAHTMAVQKYDISVGDLKDAIFEERYWSPVNSPILNQEGELTHIIHHVKDVTAQIRSEAALRESEKRFKALTLATTDVVYRMNTDWSQMHKLDGRGFLKNTSSKDKFHIESYVYAEDIEQVRQAFENAFLSKSVFELEHRVVCADGSYGWAHSKAVPLLGENGEIYEWIGAASNISARKSAELALKRQEENLRLSENRLRTLITATAEVIYRMSPDWSEIHQLQGRGFLKDVHDSKKMWLDEYVPFEDQESLHQAIDEAIREKSKLELELRVKLANGSIGWIETRAIPILDEYGNITEWLGASTDITARKIAELELKEAGRRKDDFLAMLAHELRNPLSPISAAAELLSLVNLNEGKVKQCSETILRQVRHMTSLVDDLLDVSRVTRGLISLELQKIDLKEIIADSAEQVKPLLESHHHQFILNTPQQSMYVMGDRNRLVQVLTNILNNAAKYTPNGGNIALSLEVEGESAKIIVKDNGIGMEPDLVGHVFELFTQAVRTSDRAQGGLGIGLALVKSLIEIHHGEVLATSEGQGKGSEFIVMLPLLQTVSAEKSHSENETLAVGVCNRLGKVMIVDDNVDAADTIGLLLEMTGYEVIVEYDSQKALDRSKVEKPLVCILDIGLPEMDGKELATRLRAQDETSKATLIALTGYGAEQELHNALDAGFDHYLVKPVDSNKLLTILNSV